MAGAYNSKYTGEELDAAISDIPIIKKNMEAGIAEINGKFAQYATKEETGSLISQAVGNIDLSVYAKTETLADYTTTADLNNTLGNYPTTDNLTETLKLYPTTVNLSETLQSYPTNSELSDTLNSYPTNSDLTDRLQSYSTTEEMNSAIQMSKDSIDLSVYAKTSTLASYATNDSVDDKLTAYPTNSDLSDTLNSYPTNSDLADTLKSYPTNSDLNSRLQSYSTTEEMNSAIQMSKDSIDLSVYAKTETLASYATNDSVDNKLTSYATTDSVDNKLVSYATNDSVDDKLTAHPTNSDLTDTLKNYPTTDTLNSRLQSYSTTEEMNSAIQMSKDSIDLSVYAKTETLANYATTSSVDNKLTAYPTTDTLNSKLTSYATTSSVDNKLSSYATTSSVDNKLKSYSTTEEMNSAIKASKDSIDLSVYAKTSTLSNYATTSSVDSKLTNYAKTSTLASYATNSSVDNKLASYATTSSVDNKLKSYSTTTEMNSAIQAKVNSIDLSVYAKTSTLSSYATNSSVDSKIAEVNGKLALEILPDTDGSKYSRLAANVGKIKFNAGQIEIDTDNFKLKNGDVQISGVVRSVGVDDTSLDIISEMCDGLVFAGWRELNYNAAGDEHRQGIIMDPWGLRYAAYLRDADGHMTGRTDKFHIGLGSLFDDNIYIESDINPLTIKSAKNITLDADTEIIVTTPKIKVNMDGDGLDEVLSTGTHRFYASSAAYTNGIFTQIYGNQLSWWYKSSQIGMLKYDGTLKALTLSGTWYGTSGQAIASWRGAKHDIEDLSDKYSVLFDNLKPVRFKYNDGESDRYHTGLILDELKDAMDISGLTSQELAAYCVGDTNTGAGGIRYSELIALNIYEIQKLKRRVQELEELLLTNTNHARKTYKLTNYRYQRGRKSPCPKH